MAILAPSSKGLNSLLNACSEYCLQWDICLNSKKSKLMYFGKRIDVQYDISLNGEKLNWTDEWSYLGVNLRSSQSFNCSINERIRKFYRCANAIFRIDGRSNDKVMLNLVETHCVPLLTYAIEVVHVANRDEKRQLRVAYNSLFRKIFGYRWCESVTALQGFLGRPAWEQLVDRRTNGFITRLQRNGGDTLAHALLFLFIDMPYSSYYCRFYISCWFSLLWFSFFRATLFCVKQYNHNKAENQNDHYSMGQLKCRCI